MKPIALAVVFSAMLMNLKAQTPEIAFKSHSGHMNYFRSEAATFFGNEKTNFGLPPYNDVYLLDSVIYESPGSVIVVSRQFRHYSNQPKDSMEFVKTNRDNLSGDPLFGRQHALDSIRSILKKEKRYSNPVKQVVFVGYDNKKSAKKNKTTQSVNKEQTIMASGFVNNDHDLPGASPVDRQWVLMAGLILVLSLAGGWISWKWYAPKLQQA